MDNPPFHCSSSVRTSHTFRPALSNRILVLAKCQVGSQVLQLLIMKDGGVYVDIIIDHINPHLRELMQHPIGNLVIQTLIITVCTQHLHKINTLIDGMESTAGGLVPISLNHYGMKPVLKLIENLGTHDGRALFMEALQPGLIQLIKHENGSRVIQHCLEFFTAEDNQSIFNVVATHFVEIATDQHGHRILKECIDQDIKQHQLNVLNQAIANALELAQDAFGNYVVQHIIKQGNPLVHIQLASQFRGNYVPLSMQKYSSHVVEQCLKLFGQYFKSMIVEELLSVTYLEHLLEHRYANYVIFSALQNTKGVVQHDLVRAIRPHSALRSSQYCKRIFSHALLKKYSDC